MRSLKSIFDFYLDASIHVALAVISLTGVTFYLLDASFDPYLLGFIFFGVIVCYNFVKYGVEAYKYLIVSNAYHKIIQIFSFLAFVFALYFMTQLNQKIWVAIAMMTLLSALYAVPLLPRAKNLRNLGGFKIYIVALVWVGFTVLLPAIDAKIPLHWDVWILFLQRFILVVVLILPFEIRDLQWDDKNLKTLPQVYGIKKTKKIGIVLTVIFFLLTFLRDEIHEYEVWLRFILGGIMIFMLLSSQKMQSKYYVSFWVEGIPMLWLGMFWVVKNYL
ncbi:hypothetical protein J0X14_05195 [Muricauda sp. CAU 1633]|uniref:hypothetical protein n=1 Tax=Allomuricauda sp. CAU 1633 TaxID=2816036 RepID=UPI001A8CBD41|nr:hypothetical protein [Muricauda sp. CAU 1633]MBO0321681.1 hypothetical protein [Muricauda sp. CAU 1633]